MHGEDLIGDREVTTYMHLRLRLGTMRGSSTNTSCTLTLVSIFYEPGEIDLGYFKVAMRNGAWDVRAA